jgi:glycosyltransferase involved in cell wall biosynthesis
MNVLYEEHAGPRRAGGIEAATTGLITTLTKEGVVVTRRFADDDHAVAVVPDCVHIHGIWSPKLAMRFLQWRRQGIPCIVTVHGMLEPWALAHKRLKKQVAWHIYQKRLLNRASALHATSERESANLRQLGLKPPIVLIPWGIDMPGAEEKALNFKHEILNGRNEEEGNAPACHSKSKIQNLEFSPPLRTALFVGRIYPVKGLPLLVDAWAKVRPAGWKMKIVGPDEAGHLAEVEALVRRAGLTEVFEFTGALQGEALRNAYEDANLFILPSYTENFGMVVAEALAHGLPVLTTQGAPWRLLEEERCGWWVPVSVDGIVAALDDSTRKSPEELSAMGGRGKTVVQERFAWDGIARQFLACYQWLLGGGSKPECIR